MANTMKKKLSTEEIEMLCRGHERNEEVHADALRIGDLVWCSGYLWCVDVITREPSFRPDDPRTVLTTHWAGIGRDPNFFNDDFHTAHIDSITWCRVKASIARKVRSYVRAKGA
jgi:hypothetical protein